MAELLPGARAELYQHARMTSSTPVTSSSITFFDPCDPPHGVAKPETRGERSAVDSARMRAAWLWSFVGSFSVLLACDVAEAIAAHEASDGEPDAIEAAAGVSETQADRFVGQYAFAGGQAQKTALRDAIEELVAQLNAVIRGVAAYQLSSMTSVAGFAPLASNE